MGILRSAREAAFGWPLSAAVFTAAAVLAFTVFAPCFQESDFKVWPGLWPDLWRYADSGTPMLLEADGYHYLERAEYALRHGDYSGIPILSLMAAQGAKLLPASLERIAFLLPIFFSLALAALALAWGAALGASWPARLTGTAVCLMVPAWLERSGPGWFDTDPLIAVLWQGSILFLAHLTARLPAARKAMAACGLVLSMVLLSLAWKPGLGLVALALGLWLALPPEQGGCPYYGARTRRALWGGLAALALAFALAPEPFLPRGIFEAREYLADHLSLAFGEKRTVFSHSIAELGSLNAWQWLEKLGGSTLGGILVSFAALAAFFAFPALRPALWLSVPFLVMGFWAERFLYLGVFMPAFCVGLLPAAARRFPGKAGRNKALQAAALVAVLVCLASSATWSMTRSYDIHWLRPHDAMLLRLRDVAPKDAALWNWWDEGYFLKARTGLTPLFHGGSQTALMASIAARPLVMDDPLAARRWIRFFALRGHAGLDALNRAWGAAALDNLELAFRAPDPQAALAALPSPDRDAQWFFPEGRVFLFLPKRFLDISRWWIKAARPEVPGQNHIETLPAADFEYDKSRRAVRPPGYLHERGYTGFGAVIATDLSTLGPPWPEAPGPYLVYSPSDPLAYIVNEISLKSLTLRLFTAGQFPVPGFAPVSVDAAWGGVWEVLP